MSSEHDRELDELYRALPREEPPAWLDARILAASRAEASAQPKPVGRIRWQAPFALAAVVVLAVSVVFLADEPADTVPVAGLPQLREQLEPQLPQRPGPPQPDEDPSRILERARSAASASGPDKTPEAQAPLPEPSRAAVPRRRTDAAPPAGTEPAKAEAEKRAIAKNETARIGPSAALPEASNSYALAPPRPERALEEAGKPHTPVPDDGAGARAQSESQPQPQPQPEGEHAMLAERSPLGAADPRALREQRGHLREQERESAAAAQPAETAEGIAKPEARKSPEQWLREIEQLRAEGQAEEARKQLDEFRRRFPDHPLPPALR